MRILAETLAEIKAGKLPPVLADIGLALVIILSVTGAFALGRLSALEGQKESVHIYDEKGVEVSQTDK